jgi:ATP-dependent protease ClpP protease subunit
MYLNYNKKRKLDELIISNNNNDNISRNNIFRMLKLTKHTKTKNDEDDEDDENSGDDSNNLGIPGLFDKPDDKLIYLKDNHLYFHTDVSEESVDEVKKLMRTYWNKFSKIAKKHSCVEFKPKPLYIHIFSPGGCAYSGFSLYDFIIEYKKKIPVYTVVEGRAASAATFISVAGTKRFMTPNSYILIHQLSTFFGGNYQQIEDEFTNSKKCMDKIMEIYKTHTKINKKKLPGILKHDINWDAEECIANGLVDEIKLIDIFNDDV